jgi:hypothetical protein
VISSNTSYAGELLSKVESFFNNNPFPFYKLSPRQALFYFFLKIFVFYFFRFVLKTFFFFFFLKLWYTNIEEEIRWVLNVLLDLLSALLSSVGLVQIVWFPCQNRVYLIQ